MNKKVKVRISGTEDADDIEALYPRAFPSEDLLPLIRKLLQEDTVTSLVAAINSAIVGHIVFTPCTIPRSSGHLVLLGPLAVDPDWQSQGIGSLLIHHGIRQVKAAGCSLVLVLGNPSYYSRFGFKKESGIKPPHELPEEWDDAWQSLQLNQEKTRPRGKLLVPLPWQDPALWAS